MVVNLLDIHGRSEYVPNATEINYFFSRRSANPDPFSIDRLQTEYGGNEYLNTRNSIVIFGYGFAAA